MSKNIISLATKMTDEVIRVELTDQEIADAKSEVSKNLMETFDLEEQLKEEKDKFKAKIDPLKKRNKALLTNIRNGFIDQHMEVHNVPDDEKLIIEFYDSKGRKVGQRKMTPDERPSINFNESINS